MRRVPRQAMGGIGTRHCVEIRADRGRIHRDRPRVATVSEKRLRRPGGPWRHDEWKYISLYSHEAIDLIARRWQSGGIHRDRLRDRPFDAGATYRFHRIAVTEREGANSCGARAIARLRKMVVASPAAGEGRS